jgi:hypothetical protein
MTFTNTAWYAFRAQGSMFKIRNGADGWVWELEADFCGNINPQRALIDLGENPGGEWAADRWRFWGGRIENCMGPVIQAIPGTHVVTKLFVINTKVENQLVNTNGTGGDLATGALFHLDTVLNTDFDNVDLTLGGLNSGMAGPLPRLFYMKNCYGFRGSGSINMGLSGVKPFSTWFYVEGGSGFEIAYRLNNNQPDHDCLPDEIFKFVDSPLNVNTDGTYWAHDLATPEHSGGANTLTSPTWRDDDGQPASRPTHFERARRKRQQVLSATGTIAADTEICFINTAAGAVVATLPSPASKIGEELIVQRIDATNAADADCGADLINGSASALSLGSAAFDTTRFYSSGLGWSVIGRS